MNDPAMMTTCPTEETLAAFIDGRLEGATRNAVLEHLVVCSECRDAVSVVREMEMEEAESGTADVIPISRKRSFRFAFAALAAGVTVVFLLPTTRERLTYGPNGGWDKVVIAAESQPKRLVEPRISGLAYKEFQSPVRSAKREQPSNGSLDQAASDLAKADGSGFWRPVRALALLQLMRGDRKEAIRLIEQARDEGGDSDPGFQTDYAVVYVESTRFGGGEGDIPHALDASQRAWNTAKTPENAWNRALALEQAGRKSDALRAWQDYVALETDPQWKNEADRHISRLQEDLQ